MVKIKLFCVAGAIASLAGCAGAPKKTTDARALPPSPSVGAAPSPKPQEDSLDIEEVERKLNLPQSFDTVGFHEKRFNPCLLGYRRKNCVPLYFTMINFQVLCRDTSGTVETVSYDHTPYAGRGMKLKVAAYKDESQTDGEGYGQMRFIAKKSARKELFFMNSPPNSMALRAEGVAKIIVPSDWCGG